jgi:hypothetical protein
LRRFFFAAWRWAWPPTFNNPKTGFRSGGDTVSGLIDRQDRWQCPSVSIVSKLLFGFVFQHELSVPARWPFATVRVIRLREYNLALSDRRAASIRGYLIAGRGIDAKRLQSMGFGETQFADPDDPESGINRRVRVVKIAPISGGAIAGL